MKLKSTFIIRKIANDTVLMDTTDTGRILRLNATAADILRFLQSGLSEADIVAKIVEEYEVDADSAARDVHALLENLDSLGALEK